jgi:hypothetical protein
VVLGSMAAGMQEPGPDEAQMHPRIAPDEHGHGERRDHDHDHTHPHQH